MYESGVASVMRTWQRCPADVLILERHHLQSPTTSVSKCTAALVHFILEVVIPSGILKPWHAHALSELPDKGALDCQQHQSAVLHAALPTSEGGGAALLQRLNQHPVHS